MLHRRRRRRTDRVEILSVYAFRVVTGVLQALRPIAGFALVRSSARIVLFCLKLLETVCVGAGGGFDELQDSFVRSCQVQRNRPLSLDWRIRGVTVQAHFGVLIEITGPPTP